MKELSSFNAMVLQWAGRQPAKYRLTALAFGYRCDRLTHSFDGTLEWVSKKSRQRKGEGVSISTLGRHLRVFEASGVITVERRRNGSRNMSSVYRVDFGRVIEAEDMDSREYRAWVDSLADPPEHSGKDLDACPGCRALPKHQRDGMLGIHLANGGLDPWDVT